MRTSSTRAGLRVAGAEAEQVLGRGAGEGVDRLGRVADDAEVAPLPQPQVEQALLERVDVLVLVDDEVAVLAAHGPGDLVVLAQDADGEQQDVLEVDDPALGLDLLVGGEEPGHRGGVEAGRGLAARAVAAAA